MSKASAKARISVPEDEIVKGYEHAKGQHVLIRPKEIDDLKLPFAVAKEGKEAPALINIMAALKQSVQAKGRAKLHEAVSKRSGKTPTRQDAPPSPRPRPSSRRTAH